MSSKSTKSLNTKKNALSSVESSLLRVTFCCQRRWCCYATFSFAIRHNVNTQKVKIARGDRLSFTPV